MESPKFVEIGRVEHGKWVCTIYEDTADKTKFAVCKFYGAIRKYPILIPTEDFETCDKAVYYKYPLPKPLIDKLVKQCELIYLKAKMKE